MPLLKRLRKRNTPFLTTKMTQVENFFVGVELEDVQNPNLFYNCTLCNKQYYFASHFIQTQRKFPEPSFPPSNVISKRDRIL